MQDNLRKCACRPNDQRQQRADGLHARTRQSVGYRRLVRAELYRPGRRTRSPRAREIRTDRHGLPGVPGPGQAARHEFGSYRVLV